jgi:hypothetical protein
VSPHVYISLCFPMCMFPSCGCFPLCVFPYMVCIRGWWCIVQAVSLHSARAVGLVEDLWAQTHGHITCIQWTAFQLHHSQFKPYIINLSQDIYFQSIIYI